MSQAISKSIQVKNYQSIVYTKHYHKFVVQTRARELEAIYYNLMEYGIPTTYTTFSIIYLL